MAGFDELIERDMTDSPDPREIPEEVAKQVIQGVVRDSVALKLCQNKVMSSRQYRAPALDLLPEAYWLNGGDQQAKDKARKQTTHLEWKNVKMAAEEIAVMVAIPDAYVQDVGVDLFAEAQPRISEQIAKKLDAAVFFGDDSPWTGNDSLSLYRRAVIAGNVATYDSSKDFALQVAALAHTLTLQDYDPNAFAAEPGFSWRMAQDRTTQGVSPYAPGSGVDNLPASLYGHPCPEVKNASWDRSKGILAVGDFSKAMIGIRQDITYKLFDQGVITDDDGAVVYNAVEQDGKILRVMARFAFCSVNPASALNVDNATRYPFAFLRPADAPES